MEVSGELHAPAVLPLQGIETRFLGRPVRSLIAIGVKGKVVPVLN
jgi:hypothetical protein